MAVGGEDSQELMVEGGVAGFGVRQLPREEHQGGPRLLHNLLEYHTHMCI